MTFFSLHLALGGKWTALNCAPPFQIFGHAPGCYGNTIFSSKVRHFINNDAVTITQMCFILKVSTAEQFRQLYFSDEAIFRSKFTFFKVQTKRIRKKGLPQKIRQCAPPFHGVNKLQQVLNEYASGFKCIIIRKHEFFPFFKPK